MTSSAPPRFEPGSFRDPDTRVFHHAGGVFRGLTRRALADWQWLAKTRFYRCFSEQGRLVGTREVVERDGLPELAPQWAGVLEHARVPVVSLLRRGGPRTPHPALRRRHARDDGVRHAHAVPLPPAER